MTRSAGEPGDRFARLAATVRAEIEKIERLVREDEEALRLLACRRPKALELRGLGDIVHDFYTGAERIFVRIAPELNGGVPAGESWHRELLQNMTLDLRGIRPPVLRSETARVLEEYLRFRHLFRNVYGFELQWRRLRALARRLPRAWRHVRADLDRFLRFLDAAAAGENAAGT